ncbi:glycosyltransferase [Ectopseudomonas guguanensis]|uniref:glycosyltransferase n=1 Tax=Ectopseudomonas guguanensis TaxID=1198456 RepID=UPI00286DF07D|nr:glycosyltransferase [Pseudomonas guguanensis]
MQAPVDILNIMWGGGSAFVSVHKVHRDVLRFAEPGAVVGSLLLQGGEAQPLAEIGEVSRLELSSARIKGRGLAALRRWFDRRRLAGWLAARQPRLVLLDGIGVAAYVLPLLAALSSARVIVLFHGHRRLRPNQIRLLQSFPSERLDLVAVSATLASDLERQIGRSVAGVRIALEPASLRASLIARDEALRTLGLPEVKEGRVIGAVGRLVKEKGFALLIEAVAGWLRGHPEDRLVIVGQGPQREELAKLAQTLGVAAQVYLPGHVADAPSLYQAFDLLCIPSSQEGLGLVLPEAVIAGVPVLAADLPVFREQLDGDFGLLALDQQSWEAALNHYLSSDLSALAQTQCAGLDPERAWARFCEFYRGLLR